jgi:hypothetical protein
MPPWRFRPGRSARRVSHPVFAEDRSPSATYLPPRLSSTISYRESLPRQGLSLATGSLCRKTKAPRSPYLTQRPRPRPWSSRPPRPPPWPCRSTASSSAKSSRTHSSALATLSELLSLSGYPLVETPWILAWRPTSSSALPPALEALPSRSNETRGGKDERAPDRAAVERLVFGRRVKHEDSKGHRVSPGSNAKRQLHPGG